MHTLTFTNRQAFFDYLQNVPEFREQREYELAIVRRHQDEAVYHLDGYCKVCAKPTLFQVDAISSYQQTEDGLSLPNWRERLLCESCQLNNRQRAILHQIQAALAEQEHSESPTIYAMEQVTPLFHALQQIFPHAHCIGSEYVGPEHQSGAVVDGIRHEDAEALSFADNSIDLITSNDVLEHVNQPLQSLREIFRVLKPNGNLFLTIPFHADRDENVRRAELVNGKLTHYLPEMYHGNPMSEDGSLVFNDFGWDFVGEMQSVGFQDVGLCLYWSSFYGYLGAPLSYFYARKPAA